MILSRFHGIKKGFRMPFVLPFDKEAERILRAIRKNGKAFTCDMGLTRSWGKNYPELDDFIGVFNNRRRKESVFF
jgi:hypothetical protein